MPGTQAQANTRNLKRIWLPPRDSNPDMLIQSQGHYAGSEAGEYHANHRRREVDGLWVGQTAGHAGCFRDQEQHRHHSPRQRTLSGPSPLTPLTTAGSIVGTIQYMSPEQIEGKEADARSDIFAFGAVLYEMVAGKRPFSGKSQISLASSILESDPAPISTVKPQIPPAFERVVTTCLQKNPEERYQKAHDIKLELQWIAADKSSPAAAPVTPARSCSRERLGWAAALVAAIVLTAAAALFFYHPA